MTTTKYTWVNILHWYQPPTLDADLLYKVVEESYKPLLATMLENPTYHATININACLTYLLHKHGHDGVINDLKILIHRKQVELMDSAAYHPILPLIAQQETAKQIKINQDMNHGFFELSKNLQPTGFFLPECAYSDSAASIIADRAYKWILLDEISYNGTLGSYDPETCYTIKNTGLITVFRNRELSRTYVPDMIVQKLDDNTLPATFITATDAELYGHRHVDRAQHLQQVLNNPEVKTLTVSEYLNSLTKHEACSPIPSNWDAEEADIKQRKPYAMWQDPDNEIHTLLWKLTDLAYEQVEQHDGTENYWAARLHLEKGMSSCTYWWASGKDFKLFSGPAWKPDEIEKGANELIRSIRSLEIDKQIKIKAEHIYIDILRAVWHKHWDKT